MTSPGSSQAPTELSYQQSSSPTPPIIPPFNDFDFHFGLFVSSHTVIFFQILLPLMSYLDQTDEEAVRHCKQLIQQLIVIPWTVNDLQTLFESIFILKGAPVAFTALCDDINDSISASSTSILDYITSTIIDLLPNVNFIFSPVPVS